MASVDRKYSMIAIHADTIISCLTLHDKTSIYIQDQAHFAAVKRDARCLRVGLRVLKVCHLCFSLRVLSGVTNI